MVFRAEGSGLGSWVFSFGFQKLSDDPSRCGRAAGPHLLGDHRLLRSRLGGVGRTNIVLAAVVFFVQDVFLSLNPKS